MKNLSRPQYHRIRRILEMIREGTLKHNYPNASDFCRALQVTRRTILRDLEFLRFEDNAPIEYDSSEKGYRLTDETWSLPPVELSRREVFAFSIARKLLERFRGTSLELDMRSVLEKIGESLEGRITVDGGSLTDHFTVLHEDYVVQHPETWDAVARCVERREAMEVRYQKFNGEEKSYRLQPYHLGRRKMETQRPTLNFQLPTSNGGFFRTWTSSVEPRWSAAVSCRRGKKEFEQKVTKGTKFPAAARRGPGRLLAGQLPDFETRRTARVQGRSRGRGRAPTEEHWPYPATTT